MEPLERFAQGDMDAFETLFREFQSEVYGWIVRIVRDPNAAEDLTVEAFWRMYRAHARFDPRHRSRLPALRRPQTGDENVEHCAKMQTDSEGGAQNRWRAHPATDPDGSFGAWARRIATNLALDHLKKARRELPLLVDPAEEARANPGLQRETRERIESAFRELSPKLRVVATLALVEEVPYEEIAEALGISVVTVRVRAFRAVRILREQLADLLTGSRATAGDEISCRTTEARRK